MLNGHRRTLDCIEFHHIVEAHVLKSIVLSLILQNQNQLLFCFNFMAVPNSPLPTEVLNLNTIYMYGKYMPLFYFNEFSL
jgi:hypothetical protein